MYTSHCVCILIFKVTDQCETTNELLCNLVNDTDEVVGRIKTCLSVVLY